MFIQDWVMAARSWLVGILRTLFISKTMADSFPVRFLPEQIMEKQVYEDSLSSATLDSLESLIQDLTQSLKNSTFLTPDSEGYAESIKRWSDGVEKRAVR